MYFYPILLLSDDDLRNKALASMFKEQLASSQGKKAFFTSGTDNIPCDDLLDLSHIEAIMTMMLVEIFHTNMNILKKEEELPQIDIWRIKTKAKRLLSTIRRKCEKELVHDSSPLQFIELMDGGDDMWICLDNSADRCNQLVLKRISDVHQNVSAFVEYTRYIKLMNMDTEMSTEIKLVLESMRAIGREVKDYMKLVNSLN